MGNQLREYLRKKNFEVMKGLGYRLVEEEVIIEVIQKGRMYIVRVETSLRFSEVDIEYELLFMDKDVLSYVRNILCDEEDLI
jgi:hypothetical protein